MQRQITELDYKRIKREREPFVTFISFLHFSEIKREIETLRESQREKERDIP